MREGEPSARASRETLVWLARVLLAGLVAVVGAWVTRRTSWYLAVDQFGYLTFATDLARGLVAHPWGLVPILDSFLPEGFDADVLAQTYVYREGELYCRYAPGFPLILAGVNLLFGGAAMHYVNPIAMGVLLVALFVLARRALGSDWLALGAALVVTLLPTYVLLWSISPLRDVPAHAAALLGLAALVPGAQGRGGAGRWIASGLLLGFTVSTRTDALLYLIPAAGLALQWRPRRRADLLAGALAFLLGVLPLLVYDWIATGNPFVPTQAMELDRVLSDARPEAQGSWLRGLADVAGPRVAHAQESGAAQGPADRLLQGGGLRLAHLQSTLPKNLRIFRDVFGWLGVCLGGIGALAALRRMPLFLLTVPYVVVATLFFSLWTRPDPRYLAGGILLFSVLVVAGGAAIASWSGELRRRGVGRAVAVGASLAVAVALAWWIGPPHTSGTSARAWVTLVLEVALAAGLLAGGALGPGHGRRVFALGLGVGLSLVVGWRTSASFETRGSFQQQEVEVARSTIEAATGDRAVIFTTTDVGRPAENINFYTAADAVYLREITRWGVTPPWLLDQVLKAGFEAYLLLPPHAARRWIDSDFVYPWFRPEMVANVAPEDSRRWFVASPSHRGVPLWFVRMHRRAEPLPR